MAKLMANSKKLLRKLSMKKILTLCFLALSFCVVSGCGDNAPDANPEFLKKKQDPSEKMAPQEGKQQVAPPM